MKKIEEPYLEEFYKYIGTQVVILVQEGEIPILGIVKKRKRDDNGNVIGFVHDNPILNNDVYNIEFIDGQVGEFTGNNICEALWDQVDTDDNNTGLLEEIIGHQSDPTTAVPIEKGMYVNNGQERKVITMLGYASPVV